MLIEESQVFLAKESKKKDPKTLILLLPFRYLFHKWEHNVLAYRHTEMFHIYHKHAWNPRGKHKIQRFRWRQDNKRKCQHVCEPRKQKNETNVRLQMTHRRKRSVGPWTPSSTNTLWRRLPQSCRETAQTKRCQKKRHKRHGNALVHSFDLEWGCILTRVKREKKGWGRGNKN